MDDTPPPQSPYTGPLHFRIWGPLKDYPLWQVCSLANCPEGKAEWKKVCLFGQMGMRGALGEAPIKRSSPTEKVVARGSWQ